MRLNKVPEFSFLWVARRQTILPCLFIATVSIFSVLLPCRLIWPRIGKFCIDSCIGLHCRARLLIRAYIVNTCHLCYRYKFSRLLDTIGVDQPRWKELTSFDEADAFANEVGYPVLVRPSYVLSGAAMTVVYTPADMSEYLSKVGSMTVFVVGVLNIMTHHFYFALLFQFVTFPFVHINRRPLYRVNTLL